MKAARILLLGFLFAGAYKMLSDHSKAPAAPPAAAPAAAEAARPAGEKRAEANMAVVYYFYTDTRCSSCNTIEAYTREAVASGFKSAYKGWQVTFKGVNTDESANAHFVQDYRLDAKSVVVQKFAGDKPLKWGRLDKVWQLIGDKKAFIGYVTAETQKLLDEK